MPWIRICLELNQKSGTLFKIDLNYSIDKFMRIMIHLLGETNAVLSPDNRWMVTRSMKNNMTVWDANTCREMHSLIGHTSLIIECTFSSNSLMVISWAHDCTVRIWDVRTGHDIQKFTVIQNTPYNYVGLASASLSSDCRLVVTAVTDHSAEPDEHRDYDQPDPPILCIWDVKSGIILRKIYLPKPLYSAYTVLFSRDIRRIITTAYSRYGSVSSTIILSTECPIAQHAHTAIKAVFESYKMWDDRMVHYVALYAGLLLGLK